MIELKVIRKYQDGEVIVRRGEMIRHFLISLEGGINEESELQVKNTDYLMDIKYQTEDLVKRGKGRVAFISIEAIERRFNRNFNALINLNENIW